jgi:hypothetical protein
MCTISLLYAQLLRHYHISLPKYIRTNDYCDLVLVLNKNGSFTYSLSNNSWENFIDYYTLEGNYEIKNDNIVFTDVYTHLQLFYKLDSCLKSVNYRRLYQPDSSCIKPVKTFPFMKDIVFKDYLALGCIVEKNHIIKECPAKKIARGYKKANSKNSYFEDGIYTYQLSEESRLEIALNEDKKYELRCKEEFRLFSEEMNLLFSFGTWERKGNVLYLWDANLEHQFYGLIREDGIEVLFCRWWKDLIFKKQLH